MKNINNHRFLWLTWMIFSIVSVAQAQSTVFTPAVNYATGGYPFFVTTGDFNGDGKQDLVTANYNDNTISIFPGNGDGTFQTANSYSVGNGPRSLAVGYFNSDNNADLVVTSYLSNNVGILLGNGDGTFQSPVFYSTVSSPISVSVGDVDNDNKLDLVTVDYFNSIYSVLRGNGNGTFQNAANYSIGTIGSQALELGDVNNDGKLDLVVISHNGTVNSRISILLGNGNATFQPPINHTSGHNSTGLALGDFNQDNNLDVAVTTIFDNGVRVRLGNGNGTFQNETDYLEVVAIAPGQIITEDLDGNGSLDLAVTNTFRKTVSLYYNNGDGTFQSPANYMVGSDPFSLAAADFNGDGKLDLSVANRANNNVSVLLNSSTPDKSPTLPGLISWWRGEGNARDSIGTNHGVLFYSASFAPGRDGYGFKFDDHFRDSLGVNSQVYEISQGSVSGWINWDGVHEPNWSYSNRIFANRQTTTYISYGTLWWQFGSGFSNTGIVIVPGQWYHIAMTYDSNYLVKLYVNGALVDSRNLNSPGIFGGGFGINAFGGLVDEVQIYSRALLDCEVAGLHDTSNGCDNVAPTTSSLMNPTANSAGWNNTYVNLSLSATDNSDGAGVKNITYSASGAQIISPTIVTGSATSLIITAEGETTINYFAEDNAGNIESAQTLTVRVDKTAPTISLASPTAGNYLLNQAVTVSFNCSDALSGVASCTGTTVNGGMLDTSSIGTKTFIVNSTDIAGNSASPTTVNYNVGFGVEVLFDQTKAHKSGSTVPIKIRLVDANGANISSAATVVHAVSVIQISSQASTNLDDSGNANPDFDFRYDESLAGYIFNLKTTGYGTGIYQLNFTAGNSPTMNSVQFQVRY